MKKVIQRLSRQRRVRAKIEGTENRLRLSLYRSNRYIYAQLIDDRNGKTILGISEKELGDFKNTEGLRKIKTDIAKELGLALARKALEKSIKRVTFDRGSYKYHGKVKSFAQGAREGGLEF